MSFERRILKEIDVEEVIEDFSIQKSRKTLAEFIIFSYLIIVNFLLDILLYLSISFPFLYINYKFIFIPYIFEHTNDINTKYILNEVLNELRKLKVYEPE